MAKKRIGIGIIGAGGIARGAHIGNYQKINGVELVAVCDIVRKRAEAYADEFGFQRVYTDYRKMVKDKDIDAVSVCTPNAFHKGPTIAALRAGKHVLCEKPIATNAKDGAAMVAAAKKARRKLMIGLHHHFQPETQALKKFIDRGNLGRIYYGRVQALRRRGVPSWGVFTDKKVQGGGPLVDIGVHILYAALYLLDFPKPVSASGAAWNHIGTAPGHMHFWGPWDHRKFSVEDMATGFVRFANGLVLLVEASWAANIEKESMNVTLLGDKAGCSLSPLQVTREEMGGLSTTSLQLPKKPSPHEQEIRAFVAAIRGNKPVPIPGENALVVQKILDAIYRSAKIKKEVKIK